MNYYDYARASGQMPPKYGLCARCKKRLEVDWVSIRGRVEQMCRKCQHGLDKNDNETQQDPF